MAPAAPGASSAVCARHCFLLRKQCHWPGFCAPERPATEPQQLARRSRCWPPYLRATNAVRCHVFMPGSACAIPPQAVKHYRLILENKAMPRGLRRMVKGETYPRCTTASNGCHGMLSKVGAHLRRRGGAGRATAPMLRCRLCMAPRPALRSIAVASGAALLLCAADLFHA